MPAKAIKAAFLEMQRRNLTAIRSTGEIQPERLAPILEKTLSDPRLHAPFVLALAEYVGTALDGSIIDISNWLS